MPKWDRDKIVQALLGRQSRGLALNTGALQKSDAALAGAIAKHFHSHDTALLAAGIDPASVRRRTPWDSARVVAALLARHAAGLGLGFQVIARENMPLSGAIARCFGSCHAALCAAGIDPESVRLKVRRWDDQAILAALRERQGKGLPMNAGAIAKSRGGLYVTACNRFGSYDNALRAAGIDPGPIRQRRVCWDQPQIIKAICDRRANGLPLHMRAVEQSEPSLYDGIRSCFDSYDAALRAAGVDPAAVRKWIAWDQAKIAAALRERLAQGLEMHQAAIAASDRPLMSAMSRYYGSHDDALRAVGIDPSLTRKRRRMTDEAILAGFRAIAGNGPLSAGMVRSADHGLLFVARKRFGTFEAAVKAAGLNYILERGRGEPGHWTEQRVLQTLREMYEDGLDLRYTPMKTHNQPLFFAARELFGSYVNAVREAGIDYWRMSQDQLARERAGAGPSNPKCQARNPKEPEP